MASEMSEASKQDVEYDESNRGLSLRLEGSDFNHRLFLHFDIDVPIENSAKINLKELIEAKLAKHLDEAIGVLPLLLGRDILEFHRRFQLGRLVHQSLRVWHFECEHHVSTPAWHSTQRFSLRQPLNFDLAKSGPYREVETLSDIHPDSQIALTGRINFETGVASFTLLNPPTGKMIPAFIGDNPAKLALRGIVEVELREPTASMALPATKEVTDG